MPPSTGSPATARACTPGCCSASTAADVSVEVHQRVNVRVLELIDAASGSRLEVEGNRLPVTHSKDVIDHLR